MNLGSWDNYYLKNGDTHCTPSNDLREHTASPLCFCKPLYTGNGVYSHNSVDGREKYEELTKDKLS